MVKEGKKKPKNLILMASLVSLEEMEKFGAHMIGDEECRTVDGDPRKYLLHKVKTAMIATSTSTSTWSRRGRRGP